MNKKRIIFYICMTLIMISLAVSVYVIIKSTKNNYETAETKAFKEVLQLLESNRGKSNKKGYEINFTQDFNYEEKIEEDSEIIEYKAHYAADGSFLLSYEADNASDVNMENGFGSFIQKGKGFIAGFQVEHHEISNKETNKETNQVIRTEDHKYGVDNKFVVDNDQTNLAVMSETTYYNYNDNSKNVDDNFYGKISKDTLLETVELSSLSSAINDIMFIDVWDTVNSLLSLMHKTFKDFDSNNYEAIYKYLEGKDLKFERNDNSLIIKFKVDLDESLNENVKNNFEDILVSLEVDKTTGEIKHFEFDLSNYMESILKLDEEGAKEFASNVDDYHIEGKIINSTLDRVDTSSVNYTNYDENRYDFIDQFINHALPIREDMYK